MLTVADRLTGQTPEPLAMSGPIVFGTALPADSNIVAAFGQHANEPELVSNKIGLLFPCSCLCTCIYSRLLLLIIEINSHYLMTIN